MLSLDHKSADLQPHSRALTWATLSNLGSVLFDPFLYACFLIAHHRRLSAQVAKELVILNVLRPDDMTADDMRSHTCLQRLMVQTVLYRRWLPERGRSNGYDDSLDD